MATLPTLVSYWNLQEASGSRLDSEGSNNLTVYGANSVVTDGVMGQCFDTIGSNGLYITDGAQSGLDITGDYTLNIWYKPDSAVSGFMIGKWYHANGNAYGLYCNTSTGSITIASDSSCTGYGYTFIDETGLTFNTGLTQWYMLTAVRSGTTGKFYVDGVQVGVGETIETSGNCNSSFAIGYEAGRNLVFANGLFSRAGVWNSALADADMTHLFNGGAGRLYSELDVVLPTSEIKNINGLANM